MSRIIEYLSFCDLLISLSVMSSRFIHIEACVRIFFPLRLNNIPFYIYIYSIIYIYICIHLILIIHASVNGQLGCFYLSVIVNIAAYEHGCTFLSIILFIYPEVKLQNHMEIEFV